MLLTNYNVKMNEYNLENIILQYSNVEFPNENGININKYKLEIYTNGNIKIIDENLNTDYFYMNDHIQIIQSIINMHIFIFATLCNKSQLDNFILALKASKKNFYIKTNKIDL